MVLCWHTAFLRKLILRLNKALQANTAVCVCVTTAGVRAAGLTPPICTMASRGGGLERTTIPRGVSKPMTDRLFYTLTELKACNILVADALSAVATYNDSNKGVGHDKINSYAQRAEEFLRNVMDFRVASTCVLENATNLNALDSFAGSVTYRTQPLSRVYGIYDNMEKLVSDALHKDTGSMQLTAPEWSAYASKIADSAQQALNILSKIRLFVNSVTWIVQTTCMQQSQSPLARFFEDDSPAFDQLEHDTAFPLSSENADAPAAGIIMRGNMKARLNTIEDRIHESLGIDTYARFQFPVGTDIGSWSQYLNDGSGEPVRMPREVRAWQRRMDPKYVYGSKEVYFIPNEYVDLQSAQAQGMSPIGEMRKDLWSVIWSRLRHNLSFGRGERVRDNMEAKIRPITQMIEDSHGNLFDVVVTPWLDINKTASKSASQMETLETEGSLKGVFIGVAALADPYHKMLSHFSPDEMQNDNKNNSITGMLRGKSNFYYELMWRGIELMSKVNLIDKERATQELRAGKGAVATMGWAKWSMTFISGIIAQMMAIARNLVFFFVDTNGAVPRAMRRAYEFSTYYFIGANTPGMRVSLYELLYYLIILFSFARAFSASHAGSILGNGVSAPVIYMGQKIIRQKLREEMTKRGVPNEKTLQSMVRKSVTDLIRLANNVLGLAMSFIAFSVACDMYGNILADATIYDPAHDRYYTMRDTMGRVDPDVADFAMDPNVFDRLHDSIMSAHSSNAIAWVHEGTGIDLANTRLALDNIVVTLANALSGKLQMPVTIDGASWTFLYWMGFHFAASATRHLNTWFGPPVPSKSFKGSVWNGGLRLVECMNNVFHNFQFAVAMTPVALWTLWEYAPFVANVVATFVQSGQQVAAAVLNAQNDERSIITRIVSVINNTHMGVSGDDYKDYLRETAKEISARIGTALTDSYSAAVAIAESLRYSPTANMFDSTNFVKLVKLVSHMMPRRDLITQQGMGAIGAAVVASITQKYKNISTETTLGDMFSRIETGCTETQLEIMQESLRVGHWLEAREPPVASFSEETHPDRDWWQSNTREISPACETIAGVTREWARVTSSSLKLGHAIDVRGSDIDTYFRDKERFQTIIGNLTTGDNSNMTASLLAHLGSDTNTAEFHSQVRKYGWNNVLVSFIVDHQVKLYSYTPESRQWRGYQQPDTPTGTTVFRKPEKNYRFPHDLKIHAQFEKFVNDPHTFSEMVPYDQDSIKRIFDTSMAAARVINERIREQLMAGKGVHPDQMGLSNKNPLRNVRMSGSLAEKGRGLASELVTKHGVLGDKESIHNMIKTSLHVLSGSSLDYHTAVLTAQPTKLERVTNSEAAYTLVAAAYLTFSGNPVFAAGYAGLTVYTWKEQQKLIQERLVMKQVVRGRPWYLQKFATELIDEMNIKDIAIIPQTNNIIAVNVTETGDESDIMSALNVTKLKTRDLTAARSVPEDNRDKAIMNLMGSLARMTELQRMQVALAFSDRLIEREAWNGLLGQVKGMLTVFAPTTKILNFNAFSGKVAADVAAGVVTTARTAISSGITPVPTLAHVANAMQSSPLLSTICEQFGRVSDFFETGNTDRLLGLTHNVGRTYTTQVSTQAMFDMIDMGVYTILQTSKMNFSPSRMAYASVYGAWKVAEISASWQGLQIMDKLNVLKYFNEWYETIYKNEPAEQQAELNENALKALSAVTHSPTQNSIGKPTTMSDLASIAEVVTSMANTLEKQNIDMTKDLPLTISITVHGEELNLYERFRNPYGAGFGMVYRLSSTVDLQQGATPGGGAPAGSPDVPRLDVQGSSDRPPLELPNGTQNSTTGSS